MSKNQHAGGAATPEQMAELGRIFAALKVGAAFGGDEAPERAMMAGMIATLNKILSPAKFAETMKDWDVDAFQLTDLFGLGQSLQGLTDAEPANKSTKILDV